MSHAVDSTAPQSWWSGYAGSFIKAAAIGTIGGIASKLLHTLIIPTCVQDTSRIGDYLCMRTAKLVGAHTAATFLQPLASASKLAGGIVQYLIPVIPIHATKCAELFALHKEIVNGNSPYKEQALKVIKENNWLNLCCEKDTRVLIASALGEDLIFRIFVQTAAPFAINKILAMASREAPKKLPKKLIQKKDTSGRLDTIRAVLSHPATRIIGTSLIFAVAHQRPYNVENNFVIGQFVSSALYATIYEKSGFFASALAHTVHNLWNAYMGFSECERFIPVLLTDRIKLI